MWSKLDDAAVMEAASSPSVHFGASSGGGFIWPAFLPAYDAMATLAQLLDLLAETGWRVSDVVGTLPAIHVVHRTVPTPWERKGAVMRELIEHPPPGDIVLIDGVKVTGDDGWTLVLPDPEDPATHVWAEAATAVDAERLAGERARAVEDALL